MIDYINEKFKESIQIQITAAETLPNEIAKATTLIVSSLLQGGKIISCGAGVSTSNAIDFSALLNSSFNTERPSLPSIALSSDVVNLTNIAFNYGLDEIFSQQVKAIANKEDILIAICSDGNTNAISNAVAAALKKDLKIIALTGNDGGVVAGLLGEQDLEIRIPSQNIVRVKEMQLFALNCIIELVEQQLFPIHKD
ncbi:phosphoheptose isomerase [Paraphotobacterium marinum]|uniref:Phosphoheptose isomerase n=1 Tax=Paraphotobacterium marinum TaxID=1755811 RepID=A0A220VD91_9GAMM|nr:SIS domain-containing protein [Paraphotobacterium marinum]ASK77933.1 phosphoheptose isomerase [Paraphotobacterium marinum]